LTLGGISYPTEKTWSSPGEGQGTGERSLWTVPAEPETDSGIAPSAETTTGLAPPRRVGGAPVPLGETAGRREEVG
jgi:hypothetical protein